MHGLKANLFTKQSTRRNRQILYTVLQNISETVNM